MTAQQLIEHLSTLDPNTEIVLCRYINDESKYKPISGTIINDAPFFKKHKVALISAEPFWFNEKEMWG